MKAELSRGGVPIEAEMTTFDGFHWFVFSEETTGMKLVCLEDPDTGLVVTTPLANYKLRTASLKAWAGARQSRSPDDLWKILGDIQKNNVDSDQKVADMVRGYGHASVADMAVVTFDIVGGPIHLNFNLFNESRVNVGGQEKSTRFQPKFGKSALPDLKHFLPEGVPISEEERKVLEFAYHLVGDESLRLFNKWREKAEKKFTEFFKPEAGNDQNQKALEARSLDVARKFLLMGFPAGIDYVTSIREVSRIIGVLKASEMKIYKRTGELLERLFAPQLEEEEKLGFKAEAPSMVRHTEPYKLVDENLQKLETYLRGTDLLDEVKPESINVRAIEPKVEYIGNEFTAAEKMASQYILCLWPGLEIKQVLNWIHSQDREILQTVGKIIPQGHNSYLMLDKLAETTGMTLHYRANGGVVRDENRHRGFGRMTPFLSARRGILEMLGKGFSVPAYLREIPEMGDLAQEFEEDMQGLLGKVSDYVGELFWTYGKNTDLSSVKNLVPLAVNLDLFMHGDPKQVNYKTNQRVRPGGDIDYTTLDWEAAKLVSESEPLLTGWAISALSNLADQGIDLSQRPNPADRTRFFNRG